MRKGQILCVLSTLLITACGQSAGNVSLKPTPAIASSPSQPSAEPNPSSSPLPAPFNLTCRLPVIDNSDVGTNRGWITFPGGQFTTDPSKQSDGSYDWAIQAWVPVRESNVAPDGKSYVLERERLYLVNARTGTRKVILASQGPSAGHAWTVLKYASQGVFLGTVSYDPEGIPRPAPGIWLLDPASGRVRLVEATHYWSGDAFGGDGPVGGGFVWADDYPGLVEGSATKLYRLELATARIVPWSSKTSVIVLSPTVEGELLVRYGEQGRLGLLNVSHGITQLEWPPEFDTGDYASWTVAQTGVWIIEPTGIALYQKGLGIRVVAPNPVQSDSSAWYLYAAGDCR